MTPAKTNLIVPLTHRDVPAMRQAMLQAAQAGADMVECRLDYLASGGPEALSELLRDRPLPVIVTFRPKRQGGLYGGDESQRLAILQRAVRLGAEYVDVESDVPAASRPHASSASAAATKVILSYHDFAGKPDVRAILADLAAQKPDVCKIAFVAKGPEDAVEAMAAMRGCPHSAIVLAMGEAGLASRILAGKFGAFGTFAALAAGGESAPGQPTVEQIKQLYRWDSIGPATAVYGVIGSPIAHSMSPAIHNAAFADAGMDAVYLPFRVEPGEENFRGFLQSIVNNPWLGLAGLSVTIPHKESALRFVGEKSVDELSRRIGAINTIALNRDGTPRGTNTDYAGATDALTGAMEISRKDLKGLRAGVIGAGGVSRAIVAALRHYGAEVSIYNRTVERAKALAGEFDCRWAGLEAVGQEPLDILINGTSVGMHPAVDGMPLSPPALNSLAKANPRLVVFDTVYNPVETQLLARAADLGCRCVSGVEMFVNQAMEQFAFWTDRTPRRDLLRAIVLEKLRGVRKSGGGA